MKAPNAVNIKPYMIPRLKPTFFNSIPDGTAITNRQCRKQSYKVGFEMCKFAGYTEIRNEYGVDPGYNPKIKNIPARMAIEM